MPSRCSAASPALSLRRRAAIGATLVAVIEDSQGGHGVTPDNFVIKTLNECCRTAYFAKNFYAVAIVAFGSDSADAALAPFRK